MTIIKWRDSYATGVEEMDTEHRELIDIINQLYEMLREKREPAELKIIYDRLHRYTENHFQHEEQMMEESGHDGLAEQQKAHKQFVSRARQNGGRSAFRR
jgi:hemerythrin